jgi:ATP-dependent Clp protease ATP-binding subunit ClpB
MDMKLDVSPSALAELAKVGFDPVFGARPLKRAIQSARREPAVARSILQGRFGPKDVIPVDLSNGEFSFERHRALRPARQSRGATWCAP